VPIIVGSGRYGILVINRESVWKDFSKNEIKTAFKAAILIGLALNNENKQQNIRDILESLSKLEIGIFVIQNNPQNQPILKYFNSKFKAIYGYDDEKLNTSKTFEEFIAPEDILYVERLYIARQEGQIIPNLYNVKIKTAFGIKQIRLGIAVGLYENKVASYGFLMEILQEPLKTPKEIFSDLTQ
jgi:PAS domain-containing protein